MKRTWKRLHYDRGRLLCNQGILPRMPYAFKPRTPHHQPSPEVSRTDRLFVGSDNNSSTSNGYALSKEP